MKVEAQESDALRNTSWYFERWSDRSNDEFRKIRKFLKENTYESSGITRIK